jgi:hypothetical protein
MVQLVVREHTHPPGTLDDGRMASWIAAAGTFPALHQRSGAVRHGPDGDFDLPAPAHRSAALAATGRAARRGGAAPEGALGPWTARDA